MERCVKFEFLKIILLLVLSLSFNWKEYSQGLIMLLHKLCCRRIVAGEKYTPISSTLGLDRKQFCIFVMFFLSRIYLFIFGRLGRKSFFFLWNLYFTKYLAKMSSSNSNPYLAKILGIFPHDKAATSQLYILYTVQYNIYILYI